MRHLRIRAEILSLTIHLTLSAGVSSMLDEGHNQIFTGLYIGMMLLLAIAREAKGEKHSQQS